MKRRSFLAGILAASSAPAIVRASSLMVLPPQKIIVPPMKIMSIGDSIVQGYSSGYSSGRWASSTPNYQELPRSNESHIIEMVRRLRDERRAQLRALNLDFNATERRILSWQN